jgi:transcriptional regulator with GAF, ATPase, and Fis domain
MGVDRKAETASLASAGPVQQAPTPGLVLVHDGRGLAHELVPVTAPLSIGRGEEADLQLDDASASRLHARVDRDGATLTIDDLGSTHGVHVNGARVAGRRTLAPGDVVRLGRSLLIAVTAVDRHAALWWPSKEEPLLVGAASAHKALVFAERFAKSGLSLLLLGETGCGKEVVAEVIHRLSGRSGPLVGVNCAALQKDLAESQLFGHRKGAFSGAIEHQQGFFAAADGGTLLLDEVGDLALDVQAKLLRALETRQVTPVGATDGRSVDVRVIAATCQDLSRLVAEGRFRQDLYHRLNGVALWLPPLRDRNEEIALLCARFSRLGLTSAALEALLLEPWPGNVRQLRQQVEASVVRAAARQAAAVDACDLALSEPDSASATRTSRPPEASSEAGQRASRPAPSPDAVVAALGRHDGNVSHAARELGAHRAQLYRVIKEHGIRFDRSRG